MRAASPSGLTSEEARDRLRRFGRNELPRGPVVSFLGSAAHTLGEPMFLLLLAAAGIYMVLGDLVETTFLIASVGVIVAITLYQERKTVHVIEALRDLSAPRALVIRDGIERRIAGGDVVPGDVLVLREGDRVAADGTVLDSTGLWIDESLLTGESVPVPKRAARAGENVEQGTEAAPERVISGTLVVRGHGRARVTATGPRSQMGLIGQSLEVLREDATQLQRETRRLVRLFSIIALALCALLVTVYVATRGGWIDGALAGLTLAMAILPEEFPVVLAVFLALGAWRMSRINVLTRRIAAIEALGSATVLCVDKTGTLTQNRMAVRRLYADGRSIEIAEVDRAALPESFATAIAVSVLASEPSAFDPMERAFHELHGGAPLLDAELMHRYPLSERLLVVTHVWRHNGSSRITIAAKGAPESVVELCALADDDARRVLDEASRMAAAGLRVLGLASAERDMQDMPEDPRAWRPAFVGLVGLEDPLRPSVPRAMRECRAAGVRVIMITGDYPATARAVARDAGLADEPVLMCGDELEALGDADLQARVRSIDVFARVVPAQKLRIVEALKAGGEIVAMTGDGVNDAPALKASHIGIAMGGRGTDVAREAAMLVLLDDDFGSIVQAIRQGRRIFDNLRKAMSYLVSVHMPIAALGVFPVALGAPLVLFPAHVVFLEFVIDPACSIAFEAEPAEPDVMGRPPRPRAEPLIGGLPLALAVLEGALAAGFTLGVYGIAVTLLRPDAEVRGLAFTAVIVANLSLIFFARAGGPRMWRHIAGGNAALWLIVAGTAAAYLALLLVEPLRELFRIAVPQVRDLGWFAAALVGFWLGLVALNRVGTRVGLRRQQRRAGRCIDAHRGSNTGDGAR